MLEKGDSFFFEDVATGKFPVLQGMFTHLCKYGHHYQDILVYQNQKKEKKTLFGGVGVKDA